MLLQASRGRFYYYFFRNNLRYMQGIMFCLDDQPGNVLCLPANFKRLEKMVEQIL